MTPLVLTTHSHCRLVTGEIMDEDVPDPLWNMFTYLQERKDRALAQEWGVWLIKWDSERALKVSHTSRGYNIAGCNARGPMADNTSYSLIHSC